MDRSQSPPRRQRACVPCSKAKARCHFEAEQLVCERCEKMNIQCIAKATKSLRKPRQIKPLNSRVSFLEARLETLVSALEGQNAESSHHAAAVSNASAAGPSSASHGDVMHGPALAIRTPESVVTPGSEPREESVRGNPSLRYQQKQPEPLPTRQPPVSAHPPPPLGLTWPQAERTLSIFRENFMFNFPYVIIEQDVSAQQLLEDKPFLFRTIMLVAAPLPVPRKQEMKRNVMAYLGTSMLVEEEGGLELLQGLIVCLAWVDFGNLRDKKITTLSYLLLGYAHNLGVTSIPIPLLKQMGGDVPEDLRSGKNGRFDIISNLHSAEEQRAFLGCYNLLAGNSTTFGRLNPLKSQYVRLCCDSLDWTRGYPSDFFLERTIRLVLMGEKIDEAFGVANDNERPKPYLFLVEGNARRFRAELDSIMESLGSDEMRYESIYGPLDNTKVGQDRRKYLTLYYNFLLVRLYEPATYLPEASREGGAPSMYRSMCLRNCLYAAKAYFDTLVLLDPAQFMFHSINIMHQATFVMIISTRLLLIDSPDWDVEYARLTLDFFGIMRICVAHLEKAEGVRDATVRRFVDEMGVAGVTEEELAVTGTQKDTGVKTALIVDWFKRRISGETESEAGTATVAATAGIDLQHPEIGGDAFRFDLNDSAPPMWYGGLLANQAWNFDDIDM